MYAQKQQEVRKPPGMKLSINSQQQSATCSNRQQQAATGDLVQLPKLDILPLMALAQSYILDCSNS